MDMKKGRVAIMGWDMILGFLREEGKGKTTVCGFYIMMNLHSIFFTFIDDPLCYDLQSSLLQISVHLLFCLMETFVVIYVFLAFKPIWGSHREGTKNIACVCDDDTMSGMQSKLN